MLPFQEHCSAWVAGLPCLGDSISQERVQPSLGAFGIPQAKWPSEVIPAQAAPIPTVCPREGPNSQVEDQVMVSLLRDAVVEPDCGRGRGSQLHQDILLPTTPSFSAPSSQHCNFSYSRLSTSQVPGALTNASEQGFTVFKHHQKRTGFKDPHFGQSLIPSPLQPCFLAGQASIRNEPVAQISAPC